MANEPSLSSRLRSQPSAPDGEFEKFIVGRVSRYIAQLNILLKEMIEYRQPSSLRLILGPNGNGKTLLNNALRRLATEINKNENTEGKNAFTILFSRISLNQYDPVNMGIGLARGLQAALNQPPEVTYSSIAAEILRRFAEKHRPPLYLRLTAALPKYALKKVIRKYQDTLLDLVTTDEADPISAALDRAYVEIQKAISQVSMKREFARYAQQKQLGSFLQQFLNEGGNRPLSIKALNKGLYTDLEANQRMSQPQDTLRAIASIARDVDCKVLILMIDDCNAQQGQDYLLQIADSLADFTHPKLLLVVSAVEDVWERYLGSEPDDLSKKQKLQLFGNPLIVGSPTGEELSQLLTKLEELVRSEQGPEGRWVELSSQAREELLAACQEFSFREATKYILDQLDSQIRRLSPA